MKINHQWLSAWVRTDLTASEVAERFTLAGLEVDECLPVAPALDGVVVGEITEVQPHPNADRLRVCRVAGDVDQRIIVCGAPNARVGLKAPLATLGTVLPGGLKIKPARLRGVASEGMLCSEPELGLGDDAGGLMELPAEAPVGKPLADYLGLNDHILDIDLTPNRADCLSVRGLARELAALTGSELSEPAFEPVDPVIDEAPEIELLAPADCPRYIGRVIRGVDVNAATPLWMVETLRRCGMRSLGPIVDVTNYVLLELGQPMHAFDLDRLSGGIRVRRAEPGERMILLDERDVALDPDMLLICDQQRPLAIGGVIGGLDSGVGENTTDILLESAWFNPASIVGRARRLGLATESAHRFERGVDPQLQRMAMERATALILDIAGGRPGPTTERADPAHLPKPVAVVLRPDRVNRLLGTSLGKAQIEAILTSLGMSITAKDDALLVAPPSARRDLAIEVDLIEEVARLVGYDQLPVRRPRGRLRLLAGSESEIPEVRMRRQLAARGFQEIITWSFVSQDELARVGQQDGAQVLANPLSRDMAVLRTSLLPGLLRTAGANFRRGQHDFRLFELGACFRNDEDGFNEPARLSLLMTGRMHSEHASGPGRMVDFFDLKGEIEHLLALNGVSGKPGFRPCTESWLHPGQAASVSLDGESIGSFGQLHPELIKQLDWPKTAFVAELDAERIRTAALPVHRSGSRFPAVRRDLALVVQQEVAAADLLDAISEIGGERVEKCIVFDEYRGPGIDKECKSLAIGLIIRDLSRTLRDDEVDALIARVVTGLEQRFGVKLRG
ncbi:MAG: phenylalanine--tRNA ligase subunit beta [Wenzhouxiangella sp.]|nr:MAG: phenylalanine--tRNA ligase subunit beta [Wenzhouxiangella sp.]